MFASLESKSQIVGVDFSYSSATERMVSIYGAKYNSIIVDTHFIDVITMLNGMFTSEQIKSFMLKVLEYSQDKCEEIEDNVRSWGIINKTAYPTNWGTEINNNCFMDNFKSYSITFPQFGSRYIDLLIMLAKFDLNSYRIDKDLVINETMFNDSLVINQRDVGKKVSEFLAERNGINLLIEKEVAIQEGVENIIICEEDLYLENESQISICTGNYSYNMKLCEFNLFAKSSLENEHCRKFATNLNILNDIIFGITNGFYY